MERRMLQQTAMQFTESLVKLWQINILKAKNIDKFINSYGLPKLNQENVKNLIKPLISNKTEADICYSHIEKSRTGFIFYKILWNC